MLRRNIFLLLLVFFLVCSLIPARVTATAETTSHYPREEFGFFDARFITTEKETPSNLKKDFLGAETRVRDFFHWLSSGNPMLWYRLVLYSYLDFLLFAGAESGNDANAGSGSSASGGSGGSGGGSSRDDRDDDVRVPAFWLVPAYAEVVAGEAVVFQAKMAGRDSWPSGFPIKWSASGGRIDQQGRFTANQPGTYTVTATVWGKSAKAQVTVIQPAPPQPAPPELKLKPLPDRQDAEGAQISFTVELTDPAVQNVEFSMSGAPNGVQIDPSTGKVEGTIAPDNVDEPTEMMKTFHVVVTATETTGLKRVATEEFTWTIAPEFKLQPLLDLQNGEGDSISFMVKLTNSAITPNVSFSMSGAPNGVHIDPNTGQVSGTIAPDNVDEPARMMEKFFVAVTVTETAGLGRVISSGFAWTIGPEFKLYPLPDRKNKEGDPVYFKVELTNPKIHQFVQFSMYDAPEGVTINPQTGEVSGMILDPTTAPKYFPVKIRASETAGLGREFWQTFTWTIEDKEPE